MYCLSIYIISEITVFRNIHKRKYIPMLQHMPKKMAKTTAALWFIASLFILILPDMRVASKPVKTCPDWHYTSNLS